MKLVKRQIDPAKARLLPAEQARLDVMTAKEIERNAREDGDNPPLTTEELARGAFGRRVRKARLEFGLSQAEFAKQFELSAATIRDWEQGRTRPNSVALSFLAILERAPEAARQAFPMKVRGSPHSASARRSLAKKKAAR